jgi:NADPH:quinone reductase-like Zn-dependent oxidoreductase
MKNPHFIACRVRKEEEWHMSDAMMNAVRFYAYGPIDQLVLEQAPRPVPGPGEVLVRVHAAGVNPADWKIRQGWMKDLVPLAFPAIPGFELAGLVEAVGPEVTTLQVGQAVYGTTMGTYADYAVASAGSLAPKPSNLTFDEAATIPVGASTAWNGLFDVGGLQAGQRLLVHGAAGGVGLFAVQLGRWKGAQVIGTASTRNLDIVRSLGAEIVIDYTATPFERVASDVDVVFDTIGGETQERSWQVLKPGGILVGVSSSPSAEIAQRHGVRAGTAYGQATTALLEQLAPLIESGTLRPVVGPVFSLAEARQAQVLSETGHGRGRIILHIAD